MLPMHEVAKAIKRIAICKLLKQIVSNTVDSFYHIRTEMSDIAQSKQVKIWCYAGSYG